MRIPKWIKKAAEGLLDALWQRQAVLPPDVLLNDVEAQRIVSELTWEDVLPAVEAANPGKYSELQRMLRGLNPDTVWWKVGVTDDERLCARCRAWKGRLLSNNDPTLPTPEDWIEAGAKHPNCRCHLELVDPREVWKNLKGEELASWVRLNS